MNEPPICERCVHKDVCAFRCEYEEVYNAIMNAKISDGLNDNVVCVKDVTHVIIRPPMCKYFLNKPDWNAIKIPEI